MNCRDHCLAADMNRSDETVFCRSSVPRSIKSVKRESTESIPDSKSESGWRLRVHLAQQGHSIVRMPTSKRSSPTYAFWCFESKCSRKACAKHIGAHPKKGKPPAWTPTGWQGSNSEAASRARRNFCRVRMPLRGFRAGADAEQEPFERSARERRFDILLGRCSTKSFPSGVMIDPKPPRHRLEYRHADARFGLRCPRPLRPPGDHGMQARSVPFERGIDRRRVPSQDEALNSAKSSSARASRNRPSYR